MLQQFHLPYILRFALRRLHRGLLWAELERMLCVRVQPLLFRDELDRTVSDKVPAPGGVLRAKKRRHGFERLLLQQAGPLSLRSVRTVGPVHSRRLHSENFHRSPAQPLPSSSEVRSGLYWLVECGRPDASAGQRRVLYLDLQHLLRPSESLRLRGHWLLQDRRAHHFAW